ncbi:hypothetical protein T4B_15498 [Trichinella pseudospiralis]|uniref:Uncharacterized protein n=1 Tax=Trichinella pseudospiralis TaxID=6337 RepID=A0A0V1IWL3_TRIPS|nr:hypothetical protein T4A_5510 [Trichinella pseudospiralis]KRZ27146.1 hypothetical protein T4B_15498 [Trichinella pseudospiralis]KRZ38739.1 hypothetical protein T4C_1597 [Trichinella pseudospiralis]
MYKSLKNTSLSRSISSIIKIGTFSKTCTVATERKITEFRSVLLLFNVCPAVDLLIAFYFKAVAFSARFYEVVLIFEKKSSRCSLEWNELAFYSQWKLLESDFANRVHEPFVRLLSQ